MRTDFIQRYSIEADALVLTFAFTNIVETDSSFPGVLADIDEHGNIVGYEILRASKIFPDIKNADLSSVVNILDRYYTDKERRLD